MQLPRSIREAHEALTQKQYSARELCDAYLERIDKENPKLHAYLEVTPELARAQALGVDEKIAAGDKLSLLAGIPIAVKDNILVEGISATAASRILENYTAAYDATAVKLLRSQGAVILGKTNLDEFAMGSSTEHSAFGPTKNPHDPERVPGGSSGGSAAAVAAELALAALGSDTGGSIRQPASFCGVVGLKPTYGAVSRHGLIAMSSSLDVISPVAKSVEDVAVLFGAIAQPDHLDSTSHAPAFLFDTTPNFRDFRVGIPKEYFGEGLDSRVRQVVERAASLFEKLGAHCEEVSLPYTEYANPCYYIIMPAEVSANLARYDGMRYAANSKLQIANSRKSLLETYLENRALFGDESKRRIMLGAFVLSHGYIEAYYKKALAVREKIKVDFAETFSKVDILLTPTSPVLPFRLGERLQDPLAMYLADIYTVSANLAGIPALSLPGGYVKEGRANLPVGVQLMAKPFGEGTLLKAALGLEQSLAVSNKP